MFWAFMGVCFGARINADDFSLIWKTVFMD